MISLFRSRSYQDYTSAAQALQEQDFDRQPVEDGTIWIYRMAGVHRYATCSGWWYALSNSLRHSREAVTAWQQQMSPGASFSDKR
jgi:hypothetical protein